MIISGIELLLKKINILEEQNKQILEVLREKTTAVSNNCSSLVSCPVKLPTKTDNSLEELEIYLQKEEHLNIFVRYTQKSITFFH